MKIILLKDIKGVGKKFEEKIVSDGYAINMLLPKKLAVSATGPGAKQVEALKKQNEANQAQEDKKLEESLHKIAGKTISIQMKATEQGHLFEKINAEKLVRVLREQGIEISADHITLEVPIKEIGTYEVPISIKPGVESKFTLLVERS